MEPRKPPSRPASATVEGACDCHMHIVGPFTHYPVQETRSYIAPESTLDAYRAMAETLGVGRCIIVQPSCFALDNTCTLDTTESLGGLARAVVVFDPDRTTRAEIAAMHAKGARALRIQLVAAGGIGLDALERGVAAIREFGWHLELCLDATRLPEIESRIRGLNIPIVFDHMAHMRPESPDEGDGIDILLDLVGRGDAWTKLSNGFFKPSAVRARKLIDANPERILWGTDWPHLGFPASPPDDGRLFDLLSEWAPDERTRQRILRDNPTQLYFKSAHG